MLTACAVLGWLAAPFYVPLIAQGFHGPQMAAAIHMTRALMPSIIAVSLSGVFSSMLNAYHRFRSAALTGIAINVVTIGSVIALQSQVRDLRARLRYAWGPHRAVARADSGVYRDRPISLDDRSAPSGLAQDVDAARADHRRKRRRPARAFLRSFFCVDAADRLHLRHELRHEARKFSAADLCRRDRDRDFPVACGAICERQPARRRRSAVTGLRLVNFITIPSVCALIVLAHPMVQTLFQRGTFGPAATDLTASLMPFAAVGLVALSANVVLTRCCFACQETAIPVAISMISVAANMLLSLLWLPTLGARGLLLANSVSQMMQAVLLLALVARLVQSFDWWALGRSALRVTIASVAMSGALLWIHSLAVQPETSLMWRASFLFGQLAIGGAVFIAMARILRLEELDLAWNAIMTKFERNLPSAPDNRDVPIA